MEARWMGAIEGRNRWDLERFVTCSSFPLRPSTFSCGIRFDHTDHLNRTLLIPLHNLHANRHDENESQLLIFSNLHHRIIHLSNLCPYHLLLPLPTKLNMLLNNPFTISSLILCQYHPIRLLHPTPLHPPILPILLIPPTLILPRRHLLTLPHPIPNHPYPYHLLPFPRNLSNSHPLSPSPPLHRHSSLLLGSPNPV